MGKDADHLGLPPLSDEAWSTNPGCGAVCASHRTCHRTFGVYGYLVRSLPPEERGQFACPCCPDRPAFSLCLWALCPIPHTYPLWGSWMVALRVRALRRLLAPPLARQESLVEICLPCNTDCMLLQTMNEVDARLARGLPVIPTRVTAPAAQSMKQ